MKFVKKNYELVLLGIIVLLSAVIRFVDLNQLSVFTYDQARDTLFIKRILVDHKFRLIGTQSSIPGLYTPPFYYYFMAPFLLLFNFNPIGIDFATAFLGVLTIVLLYFLLKELKIDKRICLSVVSLYAFQPDIVSTSRFAWNPNTTPFFSVLAIFSLLKIFSNPQSIGYYFLLSSALGMNINLHYSGAVFTLSLFSLIFLNYKKINLKFFF